MILLINPEPPKTSPWSTEEKRPPLGLAYIAAALEGDGFRVEVLDNYLLEKPIDYIKSMIKRYDPQIVGVACNSVNYRRVIETAAAIKEISPSCIVLVGGPHPTYMPHTMIQHPEIDYVVLGEGECTIRELATHLTQYEKELNISIIKGIAYRSGKEMVKTATRPPINDLDSVPYPARHLLQMNLYDRTNELLSVKPVDTMTASRGCVFNCTFCEFKGLWGKGYRVFSPNRVVAEIDNLVNKYRSKGIYFIDDNFTLRKDRTMEICRLMKSFKLDVEWVCETRVDLVSRDLLSDMVKAGCRAIWFGIESGSPRILRAIRRGITPQQALRALKLCKEMGIRVACSFMIGIPGETLDDMQATLRLAKKLDPDWCQFNIFTAMPGGSLYDDIIKRGLYDRIEDFLVYIKTEEFDYKKMLRVQRQFQIEYNKSIKRLYRKIRQEGFFPVLRKVIMPPIKLP